jgi:hypothetical protein
VIAATAGFKSVPPTEVPTLNTRKLFCRSASVLGRPCRTEPPQPVHNARCTHITKNLGSTGESRRVSTLLRNFRSTGGGRGRRRSDRRGVRVLRMAFCSTGAAEDGRAPTEERSCVKGLGLLFDGLAGTFRYFLSRALEDAFSIPHSNSIILALPII